MNKNDTLHLKVGDNWKVLFGGRETVATIERIYSNNHGQMRIRCDAVTPDMCSTWIDEPITDFKARVIQASQLVPEKEYSEYNC